MVYHIEKSRIRWIASQFPSATGKGMFWMAESDELKQTCQADTFSILISTINECVDSTFHSFIDKEETDQGVGFLEQFLNDLDMRYTISTKNGRKICVDCPYEVIVVKR